MVRLARFLPVLPLLSGCLLLAGCGVLKERQPDPQTDAILAATRKPLSDEQAKRLVSDSGESWLYGEGLGATALNIGGAIAFPPYAIYMLANGVISLSGYQPLNISDMLPDEERDAWQSAYHGVASGPGRLAAAAAGEEFRTEEAARARLKAAVEGADPAASPQR